MIQNHVCTNCGKVFDEYNADKVGYFIRTGRIYCSPSCGKEGKRHQISIRIKKPPRKYVCYECGKEFESDDKYRYRRFKKSGRSYCSKECSRALHRRLLSIRLTKEPESYVCSECGVEFKMKNKAKRYHFVKTGKVYCSDGCAKKNALSALATLGGGRGKGSTLTESQRILSEMLGWKTEYIVTTGIKMADNPLRLPSSYAIDIANDKVMVAIEVDGFHHYQEKFKIRDLKKERFLRSIGWTIIRFFNNEVINNPEECFNKVMKIANEQQTRGIQCQRN